MAKAVGIYLSEEGAYALKLGGSEKKPRIKAFHCLRYQLPEENDTLEDDQKSSQEDRETLKTIQLQAWLKKIGAAHSSVLCLDTSDLILRELQLELSDKRKIDRVIAFQVEGAIPAIPIEDLAVSYTFLHQEEQKSKLLVLAAKKEPFRQALKMLKAAHAYPHAADCAIGGILNLRSTLPELNESKVPTVWIDVQAGHAIISLLEGERIWGLRSVRIPLRELLEQEEDSSEEQPQREEASESTTQNSEEQNIVLMEDQEEELLEDSKQEEENQAESQAEQPSEPRLVSRTQPDHTGIYVYQKSEIHHNALFELLRTELRRFLAAAPASFEKVQRIIISGLDETEGQIFSRLGQEIGAEHVVFLDLLQAFQLSDEQRQTFYQQDPMARALLPVLAGTAFKALGKDASKINFLKDEFSTESPLGQVKVPLVLSMTLIFLISVFFLLLIIRERSTLQDDEIEFSEVFDPAGAFLSAYRYAPKNIKDKRKLPRTSNPAALARLVEKKMNEDIRRIRSGDKQNPPTYSSYHLYKHVLKAIQEVMSPPPEGLRSNENPWNFSFDQIDFSQRVTTDKTTGSLKLTCYIEEKRAIALTKALEAIEIENPLKSGDANPEKIPLFSEVQRKDNSKIIHRGAYLQNNQKVDLSMKQFLFTCEFTEITTKKKRPARRRSRS